MSNTHLAFEKGVEFAYMNLGKLPLHPLHVRKYALESLDMDSFLSGYMKVLKAT